MGGSLIITESIISFIILSKFSDGVEEDCIKFDKSIVCVTMPLQRRLDFFFMIRQIYSSFLL